MDKKILLVYKSRTGFTKRYAELIAEELPCTLMDLKEFHENDLAKFDTLIYGGRFHAGRVDGLEKIKKLVKETKIKNFIVFATGATPNKAGAIIDEAWAQNFTNSELESIPHFYMQSGLNYERMSFPDRLMMKAFAAIMKKKKEKSEVEEEFEQAISKSYDISSKEYIQPLVDHLKGL